MSCLKKGNKNKRTITDQASYDDVCKSLTVRQELLDLKDAAGSNGSLEIFFAKSFNKNIGLKARFQTFLLSIFHGEN